MNNHKMIISERCGVPHRSPNKNRVQTAKGMNAGNAERAKLSSQQWREHRIGLNENNCGKST